MAVSWCRSLHQAQCPYLLSHNPKFSKKENPIGVAAASSAYDEKDEDEADPRYPFFYPGPYGRRIRRRIPPLQEMRAAEEANRKNFGQQPGKVVFMLPAATSDTRKEMGRTSKDKVAAQLRAKKEKVSNPRSSWPNATRAQDSEEEDEEKRSDDEEKNGSDDGVHGKPKELSIKQKGHQDRLDRHLDAVDEEDNDEVVEDEERAARLRKMKREAMQPKMANAIGRKRVKTVSFKQPGVMTWFMKKIQKATGAAKRAAEKQMIQNKEKNSLLGLFAKKTNKETVPENFGYWASASCYYMFMVMSRYSRMQLMLRGKQFDVLNGERTFNIMYHGKTKYLATLRSLRHQLYEECAKLIIPPMTLKELSQLSFLELQVLFKNQVKMCHKIDDLENFMHMKISKIDYFLPLVCAVPVFILELTSLDNTLLNSSTLMSNIGYEDALFHRRMKLEQQQRDGKADGGVANRPPGAGGGASKTTKDVKFKYDSVSSHAPSSSVQSRETGTNNVEKFTKEEEEREEIRAGKMTLALSQILDGAGYLREGQQGTRDLIAKHLAEDECMMVWHLPAVRTHHIMVGLIWRGDSATSYDYYKKDEGVVGTATGGKGGKVPKKKFQYKEKGIVMEVAKSDLDASHLCQSYLDAVHTTPLPLRCTVTSDALRCLSCALSLTEFLSMIPPHVTSLIMCCPSEMRLIPWHLLLIEVPSEESDTVVGGVASVKSRYQPAEKHLTDRFGVRLGPSLSIFELVSTAASKLRHSVGMHRMCAVDGEANMGGMIRSPGIRGTDLEVACMTSVWSADPQDTHILMNEDAAPRSLQTGVYFDENNADYKKFKQAAFIEKREKYNPIRVTQVRKEDTNAVGTTEGEGNEEEEVDSSRKKRREKRTATEILGMDKDPNVKVNFSSSSKGGSNKFGGASGEKKLDDPVESSDDSEDEEGAVDGALESAVNLKSITMCRVLHFSAAKAINERGKRKAPGDKTAERPLTEEDEASFVLPRYEKIVSTSKRQLRLKDPRNRLTASDVVRQLYMKNAALAVLSRFVIMDGVHSIGRADAEFALVEAMHLAGVPTVMYPLWSASGIGTLANLVFLIRFYTILPGLSENRRAVIEACRRAQFWLRDVTADDLIAFIHKVPIPRKAKDLIITEMDAYVRASAGILEGDDSTVKYFNIEFKSLASGQSPVKSAVTVEHGNAFLSPRSEMDDGRGGSTLGGTGEGTIGNRVGGDRKFFTHFLVWGAFAISGVGGNVHHPKLAMALKGEEEELKIDNNEIRNMELEVNMLRMEGKYQDAKALKAYIAKLRSERLRERINNIKKQGFRAGRGLMDGLDYLDKTFLDQDSDDSIKLSESEDDDDEEERRRLAREEEDDFLAADDDDDDDFDEDDPLNLGKVGKIGDNSALKKKFVPKPLELNNLKPDNIGYSKWKSKVGSLNLDVALPEVNRHRIEQIKKKQEAPDPLKEDNFEYSMKNRHEQGDELDESAEKPKRVKPSKKVVKSPDRLGKGNEKYLADEMEAESEEDGEDSDDSSVMRRRIHERKPRWRQALSEIRSEVRSYGEAAEVLQKIPARGKHKVEDEHINYQDGGSDGCHVS